MRNPDDARPRALVTGSSGLIGAATARALEAAGWEVVGLDLRAPPPALPLLRSVRGDVCDPDLVREATRGARLLVHTAMQHAGEGHSRETLTELALDGLQNCAAAARAEGARLIHLSSAATLGETTDPTRPRTEHDWREDPGTAYPAAKLAAGRWLAEQDAELDRVALLPAMTIGPDELHPTPGTSRIKALLARARTPLALPGGLAIVDARDVAHAVVLAAERGRSGARYPLATANLDFRALGRAIQNARGVRGLPPIVLPGPLLVALGHGVERAARWLRRPAPLTAAQVRGRLGRYAYVDSSAARAELGWRPRPLEESLHDLAQEMAA